MRHIVLWTAYSLLVLGPGAARAEPATAAAVITAAETLKGALDNLSVSLGGSGAFVIGQLSQQLYLQSEDLRRKAEGALEKPIAQLGGEAQAVARKLDSATTRLAQLVAVQRACLSQDLHLFLAGLKTITFELKEGLWFIPEGKPRLDSFQFDGHVPSIVPEKGGRLRLVGFKLWAEAPPVVELQDEQRSTVVARLNPGRGGSDDEVSAVIDAATLQEHRDQCLQVHVQTRKQRQFLWWKWFSGTSDLFLPVCVPAVGDLQLALKASIDYVCQSTQTSVLAWQGGYYAENHSCQNSGNVGGTQHWNVPANCRIVSVQIQREGITRREAGATNYTFGRDWVTLTGALDRAHCTCAPIVGCQFHSHSVWSYSAQPTISCTTDHPRHADGQAAPKSLSSGSAQWCVELPKECSYSRSDFSFALLKVGNPVSELFASPRTTVLTSDGSATAQIGKLAVNATYTPGVANTAQVCAQVAAATCGY